MFDHQGRFAAGQSAARSGAGQADRFWEPARSAKERLHASGDIALSACGKLADVLIDPEGALRFEAEGFTDVRGRPGLHLMVGARLRLRCQRCLEPMDFALDSQRDIVLVEGASEFEQGEDEDDASDFIPLTPKVDLWALAEEEAVLCLPLAPHHADGQCGPVAAAGQEEDAGQEPSAFAALAKLKGRQPE